MNTEVELLPTPGMIMAKPKTLNLDAVIKDHTMSVMTMNDNCKRKTADDLGITIKTLYNWLHQWGEIDRVRKVYQYK